MVARYPEAGKGKGTRFEQGRDAVANSMQRYMDVLRAKVKSPVAIVLGAPAEAGAVVDALRLEGTVCYQMDLYSADRLKEVLKEQNLQAEVVAAADAWDVPGQFASVIYISPVTGERSLKLDMVEQSYHLLQPGGTFYVLSPFNPDSFFAAQMKKIFGAVRATPLDDATIFWSVRKEDRPRRRHEVTFRARDGEQPSREFLSRPGVFSYGKMDDGTRALADCMIIEPDERIVDLGCGCGAAGIFAGLRGGPNSRVTFVDSNVRSIAVASMNATSNEVPAFTTLATWQPEKLPRESADVILANPPYFGGGEIAARFIDYARIGLKPGGRLYLVTKLTGLFGELLMNAFEEVAAESSRGYEVFSARIKQFQRRS
ncbi:methyltransferase [soil metagenome]